jgi:Uma2 family endonuclease
MNVQLPVHMDKPSFLAWVQGREERYELAGGRVLMMTGGTMNHGLIVGNLFETLRSRLDRKTWAVLMDFGIDVGPRTIRYPDVVVLARSGASGMDLTAKAPALVAEVLSPSSEKIDLGDKAAEYLQLPNLGAYLVLAQDEVKAWAYIRGAQRFPAPQVVTAEDGQIKIPALGIDLPLADIYAGIEFE